MALQHVKLQIEKLNSAHISGTQYKSVKTIMLSNFHINLAARNCGAVKMRNFRKENNTK